MNKPFYQKSQFWLFIFFSFLLALRFMFPSIKEDKAIEKVTIKEIPHVRTEIFNSESFNNQLKLYSNTTPVKHSDLFSKFNGEIIGIYHKQGDFVKSGEAILKIKDKGLNEKVESSKLALEEAKLEYNSAVTLKEKELISQLVFLNKQTALKRVNAEYENAVSEFEDSIIKAHFDGIVESFDFQKGDYVFKDQKLATLSDLTQLKTYAYVPETYIKQITKGSEVVIKFQDKNINGFINYIPKVGDQQTHTFKVEILTNKSENLISGLTAPIFISLKPEMAFNISPSFINLDDDGNLIVKIVEKNLVKNIAIKIINQAENGVWIKSLNENYQKELNIITIGHILVNEGTKVKHSSKNKKGA
jgi:RND family efflux transporter MFP subunit